MLTDVVTAPAAVRRLADDIRHWFRVYKVRIDTSEECTALPFALHRQDATRLIVYGLLPTVGSRRQGRKRICF